MNSSFGILVSSFPPPAGSLQLLLWLALFLAIGVGLHLLFRR
jgi:hypothetical protein